MTTTTSVAEHVGEPGGSWTTATLATDDAPREFEPTDVTPGVLGFAVTFAVVIGLVVLLLSMVGKLRRVDHRAGPEKRADDGAGPRGDRAAGPTTPPDDPARP